MSFSSFILKQQYQKMKDLGDHLALMKQQIREKTWAKTNSIENQKNPKLNFPSMTSSLQMAHHWKNK